jgi:SAM-dependent methyltransferase
MRALTGRIILDAAPHLFWCTIIPLLFAHKEIQMHLTAMSHARLFFDAYATKIPTAVVVDIGAQDVNGSLKEVCPPTCKYIGVDFVAGKGVDVVLEDPYKLPFEDGSVDIVVSSSCYEHTEMFWLAFLEVLRILKPSGLFYLNVPSNGEFHRYPVDCWRFYPDSGNALVAWARRNDYPAVLLESFIGNQGKEGGPRNQQWNDYIAVFLKDATTISRYPDRILDRYRACENAHLLGSDGIINEQTFGEDGRKVMGMIDSTNNNYLVRYKFY